MYFFLFNRKQGVLSTYSKQHTDKRHSREIKLFSPYLQYAEVGIRCSNWDSI